MSSKYTAFRCPEELLPLARYKAKKDRRSLSNYIVTLIEKDTKDVVLPVTPAKVIKRATASKPLKKAR